MSAPDLVADDELLLRHIPGGTTWQAPGPRITSRNFRPRSVGEGVSVSRTAITSAEQLMARLGDPAKGSQIASVTVGEIRALGLDVVSVPKEYDLGHAEIRSASADLNESDVQRQLAKLFEFLPPPPSSEPPPAASE